MSYESEEHIYSRRARPAWKVWLDRAITVVIWILIAYAISTWIPALYNSVVGQTLAKVVGPILAPLDAIIPSVGGIGISILVLFFGLSFLQRLLRK